MNVVDKVSDVMMIYQHYILIFVSHMSISTVTVFRKGEQPYIMRVYLDIKV